jgi:hypothetical protein
MFANQPSASAQATTLQQQKQEDVHNTTKPFPDRGLRNVDNQTPPNFYG